MIADRYFNKQYWVQWQQDFQSRMSDTKRENLEGFLQGEFPRANILFFTGMKRSGNHPIINWMIQNCYESTLYLNSVSKDMVPDLSSVFHADYLLAKDIDRVIVTFENVNLPEFSNHAPQHPVLRLRRQQHSLIARDPFNWLASWISHFHFVEDSADSDIKMYIENIEQIDRKIFFNRWFSSLEYRNTLARDFGFANKDLGVESVRRYGKGSSFDRVEYDGRASEMKVLERWERVKDSELYCSMISKYRTEFSSICEEYFPNVDYTKIISSTCV